MKRVADMKEAPCVGCSGCRLAPNGYAGPVGPPEADVLVVGEAPGEREAAEGVPFIGPSGKVLRGALRGAGFDPDELRFVNIVQCRPPGNRDPKADEIARCTVLDQELASFKGRVVLAVGRKAADRLVGKDQTARLTRSRSTWDGYVYRDGRLPDDSPLRANGIPVVCVLHPSGVIRKGFSNLMQLRAGIMVAKKVVVGLEPEVGAPMDLTITDITKWPMTPTECDLAIDIENNEFGITHIGFCFFTGSTIHALGSFNWTPAVKDVVQRMVGPGSLVQRVWAHNASYDVSRLEMFEGIEFDYSKVRDTMMAAAIEQPDLPKALGAMWRYLTRPAEPWKDEASGSPLFYNATDVYRTAQIAYILEYLLKRKGQLDLLERQTQGALVLERMTRGGIRRDLSWLKEWRAKTEAEIEELEAAWESWTRDVNNDEPVATAGKNLAALLYDRLGFEPRSHTSTGQPSLTEADLERIREDTDRSDVAEGLSTLIALRQKRKELKTYGGSFDAATDDEGFLHPSYVPDTKDAGNLGSAAGRLSSSPNIQNVPKRMRRQFVPDQPGWVIGDSDLSAVENRVGAALAGDSDLLSLMDNPEFDPHEINLENAEEKLKDIWRERAEHGPNQAQAKRRLKEFRSGEFPLTRRLMKTFIYGWQYGAGVPKIAQALDITRYEAQAIMDAYEEWRPLMAQRRQAAVVEARSKKQLQNPFGRIRYFYGAIPDPHVQNSAINFGPQSTVADMFWSWFGPVFDCLERHGGRLLTQVHDSFVWTAPAEKVDAICADLDKIMGCEWPQIMPGFRVPVGHEIGPNWRDMVSLAEWRSHYEGPTSAQPAPEA